MSSNPIATIYKSGIKWFLDGAEFHSHKKTTFFCNWKAAAFQDAWEQKDNSRFLREMFEQIEHDSRLKLNIWIQFSNHNKQNIAIDFSICCHKES